MPDGYLAARPFELEIWMYDDGKYLHADGSCINTACYGVYEWF